ncbi:MAG: 3-keto-disaccharide hydrolase [Akkermansiaceae bacterium]
MLKKSTLISLLIITQAFAQAQTPAKEKVAPSPGFTALFNGKNLDGWYLKVKNDDPALAKQVFAVKDGFIHVFDDSFPDEIDLDAGIDKSLGMMYTKKEYSKYHLKFDYKWGKKKANYFKKWKYDAGVYYHVSDDKIYPTGIEFQIMYDHTKNKNHTGDSILPGGVSYDWYYSDKTYAYLHPDNGGKLIKPKQKLPGKRTWLHEAKPTENYHALDDQWNTCELIVMGGEYAIYKLNGEIVNMIFNLKPEKGILGLQSETAEIFYRNIQIKEFTESVPAEQFLKPPSK